MEDDDTPPLPATAPLFDQRPSHWRETVLICRKCSKKLRGGFGPRKRTSLRKLLRKALNLKKGRRAHVGIVEVGCFDLCPKKAVSVCLGSSPRTLHLVPKGADAETVIAALRLPRSED